MSHLTLHAQFPQRDAWFPYFDDINALIFLAPIACFDETLEEDSTVNRIEDSLLLWKGVCNSQLLVNVQFVLFLNKCDLLSKKLNSANVANVRDHFPAFGDQRQNLKNIGACESMPLLPPLWGLVLIDLFVR